MKKLGEGGFGKVRLNIIFGLATCNEHSAVMRTNQFHLVLVNS